MIDFALKYQAVIFCSAEEITATPNNLTYFIERFKDKELIPSSFQELAPTGISNRMSLKSSDDVWKIEFASNRIDIVKFNSDIGKIEMGSLSQFVDEVKEIINIIFEKFNHKAHRISIVTKYILESMEANRLNKILNNISTQINLYTEDPPITWSQRFVTRIKKEFNQVTEILNVISEIKRINGSLKINSKIEKIDRIELKFDINTYQGNTEYRFPKDNIMKYYDDIIVLENSIKEEYIEIFNRG